MTKSSETFLPSYSTRPVIKLWRLAIQLTPWAYLKALGPPDVLITGIDLHSELNGFEVASYAHHLWPKVRIILISGLPADRAGQPLDPRDRFIQKPLSADRLLGAIAQLAAD